MRSLNKPAFDANLNPFGAPCLAATPGTSCGPTRSYQVISATDIIWHF
jgi:hypothetical protein